MIERPQLIAIGRYNKPHGVRGELSATLDVDFDLLSRFRCLISDMDGIFVPFFVRQYRRKSASTALLTIDGMSNEQDAAALVNKEIFVDKNEYMALAAEEESDALPLDYFIGFEVFDSERGRVGVVTAVDDSTENVLFVVTRENGDEILVPVAEEWIEELDNESRKLVMSLPDGLCEL